MSYHDLARLGVTVRPITVRPAHGNRGAQFRATLQKTVRILANELDHLDAERIVLELDLSDREIRLDGLPRADARPGSPAVGLSFDSRFGPLRYATCEFTDWTDNLRAIALAMEALRAVDRYGVSKRGEQYTGWRAIPSKTGQPEDLIETADDARRFLDEHGGSFKAAAAELHPDKGGNADLFRAAVKARELLGAGA